MATLANIITFTNNKIANWYENAKIDFGVIGTGSLKFENNKAIVNYTENGENKVWEMPFYPEYATEQSIEYVYNCWAELS